MRPGLDRLFRQFGALLPGFIAGTLGGFLLLKGSRHPDRLMRGVLWGAFIFLTFAVWQQLVSYLSGKCLTLGEKAAKFFAYSSFGFLSGFCYGASFTPPNPNPGDTLGGTIFGLIGLFLGACLGWTWPEPVKDEGPDIGFEG